MAYRADIEIAVRGAQELRRLSDQIAATSKLVDELNSNLANLAEGGVVRNIENLQRAANDAAIAFNKVALGTDEATLAAKNFIAANKDLNTGLQERVTLLNSINEAERKQRLAAAGIKETAQYVEPIGPGAASSVALASQLRGRTDQILKLERLSVNASNTAFERAVQHENTLKNIKLKTEEFIFQEKLQKLKTLAAEELKLNKQIDANILADFDRRLAARQKRKAAAGPNSIAADPTGLINTKPGFENLALGAGFPLLFGGGAGQVAGGLLGSFVGTGFGGQILGSAIGQQLEDALRRITDISNASRTLNLDTLRESAIAVNAELAISVEQLKKAGQGEAARAAIASRVALQTGLLPEETQATAQAVGTLNTAWNEVVGAVSGLLSILGRPIVSALAVILQGIAKAVQGVNLLLQLLFKHVPVLSQIAWLFNEINKRLPFINEEQEKQYTAAVAMTDQLNKEIMLNNKIIDIQKQRTLGLTLAERQINAGLDAQLAKEKIRADFDQKRAEINTKLAETTDARARKELELALKQTNALETQALRQQAIQDLLVQQGIEVERNNEKYQQAADAVQRQRDALERSNAITQSRLSAESALNDLYGAQLQRQYELATTAQQRFNIAIKQFYQQVAAADIEYRQAKANNELLIQKAQLEYKLVEIKYQQIAAEKALGVAQATARGNTPEQVQAIAGAYDKALGIQTEIIQASRDQISATVQIAKNQDQIAAAVYQTKLIQAESQLAQRLTSNEIGLSKQSADRLAGSLAVGVMQASKMQSALFGVSNAAATAAANIARATGQSYVVTQRTEQATATGNVMTAQYQYANGTTGYSYIKAHYAKGGYVNSPTVAMIGEGGQGEYVVPESKAAAFAMNYMLGARGAGAIDGNASSPAINITTGPVMQQGGQNYVTIQDMEAGLQAVADTILNNSRSYSSRRFTGVA